jgi:hypothetical protein
MNREPGESFAADRARWLAELSESLDEAQKLLVRLGIGTADSPLAMELYLRIEGARFAVQSLRLRPMGAFSELTGPKWSESMPWPWRDDQPR